MGACPPAPYAAPAADTATPGKFAHKTRRAENPAAPGSVIPEGSSAGPAACPSAASAAPTADIARLVQPVDRMGAARLGRYAAPMADTVTLEKYARRTVRAERAEDEVVAAAATPVALIAVQHPTDNRVLPLLFCKRRRSGICLGRRWHGLQRPLRLHLHRELRPRHRPLQHGSESKPKLMRSRHLATRPQSNFLTRRRH